MRLNASLGLALTAVCSGTVWGCGSGGHQLSPVSPSPAALSAAARPPPGGSSAGLTSRPRQLDKDGDGYEDPPEPAPVPSPDPAGAPAHLTVNITGTFGSSAFAPNPLQAVIGNTIVWVNGDAVFHHIVLDDGTPVGNLAPGQSSLPMLLNVAVAGYHCAFHPSMVGQVTTMPPGASPDPYVPAPADPYGDGYEDDYYLRGNV